MGAFVYSAEVLDRFPDVRGGMIHATGLSNSPAPEGLNDSYLREQEQVKEHIGDAPLSEIPSIAAWRRAFSAFGVKPTQYRNAAESLLRRLTKKGDIPSINPLVDMANLVSIRYAMPVAVCDQRTVTGATTVRFADGTETFTDLGSDTPTHPDEGEVIFVDDASIVSARRWCWRQSAESAANPGTVDALITIEGQHESATTDVQKAMEDLLELLAIHQLGSTTTHAMLSPEAPRFGF